MSRMIMFLTTVTIPSHYSKIKNKLITAKTLITYCEDFTCWMGDILPVVKQVNS